MVKIGSTLNSMAYGMTKVENSAESCFFLILFHDMLFDLQAAKDDFFQIAFDVLGLDQLEKLPVGG